MASPSILTTKTNFILVKLINFSKLLPKGRLIQRFSEERTRAEIFSQFSLFSQIFQSIEGIFLQVIFLYYVYKFSDKGKFFHSGFFHLDYALPVDHTYKT